MKMKIIYPRKYFLDKNDKKKVLENFGNAKTNLFQRMRQALQQRHRQLNRLK